VPPERKTREKPDARFIRELYIDETSQTKHRYLVLGGIILNHTYIDLLYERLWDARGEDLPRGELKWTKVSRTKLPAYIRFVDVFFAGLDNFSTLDMHSIVIDTHKVDDKRFNSGSRDIGFNKEVYQLCMKFWRIYRGVVFHAYPDHRNTSQIPEDLRNLLNHKCNLSHRQLDWPFRRLHFRDSKKEQALQLVDVLIGAIAFKLNGHYDQLGASEAKRELCDYVLGRAGIQDPFVDTAKVGRFTIWHRQLK
jgi:hypothetical protein